MKLIEHNEISEKFAQQSQSHTMTDSKHTHQVLVDEESEECDKLLDMILDKETIYDLQRIPGTEDKDELPFQLSQDLNEILRSPAGAPEEDDESTSDGSDDGYLPTTLLKAISISSDPQSSVNRDLNVDQCISPPLSNKKKKKIRPVRRTKSEQGKITPKGSPKGLSKSFHVSPTEPFIDDEQELLQQYMERNCYSEELKKTDTSESDKDRRKSENLHERKSRRKAKETGLEAPKPPRPSGKGKSPKLNRSRSKKMTASSNPLDASEADKRLVDTDWKRTSKDQPKMPRKQSEREEDYPKTKPKRSGSKSSLSRTKKSKSGKSLSSSLSQSMDFTEVLKGDNDSKRKSPRQELRKRSKSGNKSLSQSMDLAEATKKAADRKKPSPRQELRKRAQKQKEADATGSTDAKGKKPKSRKNMMLSSKATTPSCRNLLRKINKMNDERLSRQNRSAPIDDLSRSTISTMSLSTSNSTSQSLTDFDDTNHSGYSSSRTQEEPLSDDRDGKRRKPKKTKSAPLKDMRRGRSRGRSKSVDKRMKRSSSGSALQELAGVRKSRGRSKSTGIKLKRASSGSALQKLTGEKKKTNKSFETQNSRKSWSGGLTGGLTNMQKLLDAMGLDKPKAADDKTARTGNRSKDRQNRRKPLRRSSSESSLGLKPSSQYSLMLSSHHNSEELLKDIESSFDSDDEKSFSGDDDAKVEETSKPEEATGEAADKVTDLEGSMSSDMFSMKSFPSGDAGDHRGNTKKLSEHMDGISEDCDDIMSMAEFSDKTAEINAKKLPKTPKKPPSCLQMDFSQLSEHGTSGNIVIKNKKMAKRSSVGKSERQIVAPRSCSALVV